MAGTIGVAVLSWIGTTVAATSTAALVAGAIVEGVAITGLSYVAQSVLGPAPNANAATSYSTLQSGGVLPQSFLFGEAATAGSLVYFNDWGKDDGTPNAYHTRVIALSDVPINALTGLQAYGKSCTYGSGTPDADHGYAIPEYDADGQHYLWVKFYDGTQTSADAWMVTQFGSDPNRPYTSSRIGYGRAYVIVTMRFNQQLFTGEPGFKFQVEGAKWYDPRQDSTAGGSGTQRWDDQSTWAYSNNPQLIRYNIRRGVYYGSQWLFGPQNMSAARLPYSNWSVAFDDCETEVDDHAGGTERQYRCGGEVTVDTQPADLDESLMRACNGRSIEIGGVYKTTTGVIGTAVASYTDDNFIVTQQKTFGQYPGLSGTVNGITGHFPDPAQNWAMTDAPGLFNSDLEVEDGNRQQLADISYDCVPFAEQVQRNMKAALAEERRWRIHTAVLPHSAWQIEPGDSISWTSTENGYDNKLFRVESTQLMQNRDVQITIREADPSDYDWTPDSDFVAVPAGNISGGTLPSQAMVGWAVEQATIYGDDGRAKPAIKVEWGTTDIDDVDGVIIDIRLTSSAAIVWSGETPHSIEQFNLGAFIPPANLSADTAYQVRGKYRPISTRPTDWSDWLDITTPDIAFERIDFGPTARQLLDFMGQSFADVLDQLHGVSQTAAEAGLGAAANRQEIRRSLTALGDLTATFDERITVASNDVAAFGADVTAINAALPGKADASALLATNVLVDTQGGQISVLSGQSADLSATIGGSYSPSSTVATAIAAKASQSDLTTTADLLAELNSSYGTSIATAKMRIGTAASKPGASATIGFSISATDGGSAVDDGAFFLSTDGTTSSFWVNADQFIVSNGSDAAALADALEFVGGVLSVKSAAIQDLDASKITTGTLEVETLIVTGSLSNAFLATQTGTITPSATVATEILRVTVTALGGTISVQAKFAQVSKADSGTYGNCAWALKAASSPGGTPSFSINSGVYYSNDAGELWRNVFGNIASGIYDYGQDIDVVLFITGDGSKRPVIGNSQIQCIAMR